MSVCGLENYLLESKYLRPANNMVVQKAIFLLFFVSKVNILLGNPFPQDYELDKYGEIKYDDLDNPILLEEVNNFEDILGPGQCILPAKLQSDGNLSFLNGNNVYT